MKVEEEKWIALIGNKDAAGNLNPNTKSKIENYLTACDKGSKDSMLTCIDAIILYVSANEKIELKEENVKDFLATTLGIDKSLLTAISPDKIDEMNDNLLNPNKPVVGYYEDLAKRLSEKYDMPIEASDITRLRTKWYTLDTTNRKDLNEFLKYASKKMGLDKHDETLKKLVNEMIGEDFDKVMEESQNKESKGKVLRVIKGYAKSVNEKIKYYSTKRKLEKAVVRSEELKSENDKLEKTLANYREATGQISVEMYDLASEIGDEFKGLTDGFQKNDVNSLKSTIKEYNAQERAIKCQAILTTLNITNLDSELGKKVLSLTEEEIDWIVGTIGKGTGTINLNVENLVNSYGNISLEGVKLTEEEIERYQDQIGRENVVSGRSEIAFYEKSAEGEIPKNIDVRDNNLYQVLQALNGLNASKLAEAHKLDELKKLAVSKSKILERRAKISDVIGINRTYIKKIANIKVADFLSRRRLKEAKKGLKKKSSKGIDSQEEVEEMYSEVTAEVSQIFENAGKKEDINPDTVRALITSMAQQQASRDISGDLAAVREEKRKILDEYKKKTGRGLINPKGLTKEERDDGSR